MRHTSITWVRTVGLLAGCVLAVGYLGAGRVPAQEGPLPAHVSVSTARSGELEAAPARRMISSQPLHVQHVRAGAVLLSNPTSVALLARPVALGGRDDLDHALELSVVAGGKPVFSGSLAKLRQRGARGFVIPRGGMRAAWVRTWLAPDPGESYGGRVADVRIEWRTRVAGA